tara:strand:- start:6434 stop:7579 length:1146 start_codon:yes stop_codon:yes gene_type:complete
MQRIIYKTILLSALFISASCGDTAKKNVSSENQDKPTTNNRIYISKAQFENSNMVIGALEEKSFPTIVKANGMIDAPPENKAVINALLGGYIKTTPLLTGDNVKKGQLLVTIENPEFVSMQQQYLEVKEQLTYLKSEYERQKIMVAENITSQKNYLKAESDYHTSIATYNGLRKQLQLLNISTTQVEKGNITSVISIYSPISGSITKVNVSRGTYVSPASSIMEIIDNDHIHLELSVFEKDVLQLKKGQKINFSIPEASSDTYEAEVHLIGTAIEENRTIKVHGHLKNESESNFLIGMFVEADIITNATVSKALPETALVELDNVLYGLQLDEETKDGYYFSEQEIKVENNYGGFWAIANSQSLQNSKYLTVGAFNLLNNE